jgi:tetratricopeptide (TPR) repeat protein
MLEKVVFMLLAFSLFIIIFFKIIRRNDANYIIALVLEAIGITISFVEIKLKIGENVFWGSIRYLFSIIFPLAIVIMEIRGINFSELISIFAVKFCLFIGDKRAAKSILIKLVTKYPESYLGHKMLAECYEQEGGMRKAIDEYVTAIDIKKNDYKSYFKIAELLKDLGKKAEAIQMLETLLKTKPDCYEATLLLGELLCEEERFKEAANVYQDALRFRPNDFELYYCLGIVYTRLSDFQMAKEMYERAAEINHRMYNANYNLGLIAFIQGDYDSAEIYFKQSVYGNLEAKSYYQLAKIYVYKGEKDKAINFLNKAIELDSNLLKVAEKEKTFEKIKEFITVSVNMNEKEEEDDGKAFIDEDETEFGTSKFTALEEQEEKARTYLEESFSLIQQMSENTTKQKLDERIDYLFNKQKMKKELEELDFIKKEKKKEERQKELGNS